MLGRVFHGGFEFVDALGLALCDSIGVVFAAKGGKISIRRLKLRRRLGPGASKQEMCQQETYLQ